MAITFIELRDRIVAEFRDSVARHENPARIERIAAINKGIDEIAACQTLDELQARVEDRRNIANTVSHQRRPASEHWENRYVLAQLERALDICNAGLRRATTVQATLIYAKLLDR